MSKKRNQRRQEPVLDTDSIKEVLPDPNGGPDEGKRAEVVLGIDSIKEVVFDDEPEEAPDLTEQPTLPPEGLSKEEEMIVSEIMGIKSMVAAPPQRKKYHGDELGQADRTVFKPTDPTAHHDLEILLGDETVYVVEFRQGRAMVPQRVAEYIRANLPRGRLVVAD
jgi:hypothetical protein